MRTPLATRFMEYWRKLRAEHPTEPEYMIYKAACFDLCIACQHPINCLLVREKGANGFHGRDVRDETIIDYCKRHGGRDAHRFFEAFGGYCPVCDHNVGETSRQKHVVHPERRAFHILSKRNMRRIAR